MERSVLARFERLGNSMINNILNPLGLGLLCLGPEADCLASGEKQVQKAGLCFQIAQQMRMSHLPSFEKSTVVRKPDMIYQTINWE